MRVTVVGAWHLGTVTAACVAEAGHDVVGIDADADRTAALNDGRLPVFEPGLETLLSRGIAAGRLRFTTDPSAAARADVVWVAHDTPVDESDQADVELVRRHVREILPHVTDGAVVLVSAQLPVGTTAAIEREYRSVNPNSTTSFVYSPENLRLGSAINDFTKAERIVVGAGDLSSGQCDRLERLLAPFGNRIVWMGVESAEMTKHALNAFLATSVAFINEIAAVCECVGADVKEIECGLRTEPRIGPRAYISAGSAFAGGTLARDIAFLETIGASNSVATHLISGVQRSNDEHRAWPMRAVERLLGELPGHTVAVWGLTYKPGTDTLRRSAALELCAWLSERGGQVRAHDPAVTRLPPNVERQVTMSADPIAATHGASALVVATEWPHYRSISPDLVVPQMCKPVVIDANRFLAATFGADPRVLYVAVGRGVRR